MLIKKKKSLLALSEKRFSSLLTDVILNCISLLAGVLISALPFARFLLIISFFTHRPRFQQLSTPCGAAGPTGSLMTVASLLPAAVTDGLTALDEWRSPPWQAETNARVGGDSAAKHQPSILWGLAAVMSPPLSSVEGHGGRGRLMRAERDNVMERKRQSWWGNEGKEHVSAVRRKAYSSRFFFLTFVHWNECSSICLLLYIHTAHTLELLERDDGLCLVFLVNTVNHKSELWKRAMQVSF